MKLTDEGYRGIQPVPLAETVESGNGSRPSGIVEQITGTPPRTFRDFARKKAAAWSEVQT